MKIPTTRIPHAFKEFATSGGARIFRLPMNAFPGFWAYAYLILMDGYRVLIDAGSGFGDSNAHLEAGFEQASRAAGQPLRIEDLTHILITHGHIDHFGGLAFLHERTKAPVGIHELDLRGLTNYEERLVVAEHRLKRFLIEAGVADGRRDEILNMYRINKALFRSTVVDFTYEAAGMRLGPFEMLHVPGHCPGHVVIRLHDILFSGDHVLESISPHQWPERLTLYTGLGHYLDSLTLLESWAKDVSLTLPGHNEPIPNLPARLGALRALHAERLQKTMAILADPHTTAEVSKELFGKVSGYDVLLALEETGAHVEYLYQHGLLQIANVAEIEANSMPVALRYQRLNDPIAAQVKFLPV